MQGNPKQLSVTKIEYDEEPFELSWSNVILNSSNVNQLYDYTLFWCEKNINQPYECNVCSKFTICLLTITIYMHSWYILSLLYYIIINFRVN